jgi:acyl-homoserine lactone acylase PvdQ
MRLINRLRCARLRWAALLATGVLSAGMVAGSEPTAPGEQGLPPLRTGEVTLIRDAYGTPHLYAASEHDAFFGLGYAYGEDRLRQVLLSYLQIQGRLAEVFGAGSLANQPGLQLPATTVKDTVASDLEARRFRYLADARVNFDRLPKQLQLNLRAYIAGLQRYVDEHPERVPSWAPVLEPALPLALLAKMMTLDFADICESRRSAEPATGHNENQSNAWAVSGARTDDGAVIFSSDSHGPLQTEFGPAFYNWRMKAGALDVLSFDLPGTASFFFAHTDRFAWGWTEGKRNVVDCYAVQVEAQQPHRFRFDGKVEQFEAVPYRIDVKGAAPLTGTFEYTRHNGVRSPVVKRQGDIAYVLSSPYLGRWGLAAGEYYRMARARNRGELTRALGEREIYPANLVVAGRDGTLLYIRPGRIPVRKPGVDPERILDGNRSTTAWRGVHSYSELLKLIDPPQGYLSNSNVSPDRMYSVSPFRPRDYPSYFGFEPGLTTRRQARLLELLGTPAPLTVQAAQAIVMDSKLPGAEAWGPVVAMAVRANCDQARPGTPDSQKIVAELQNFDGVFRKESKAALYFAMMRGELTMNHAEVVDGIVTAVEQSKPLSASQQCILAAAVQTVSDELIERHGTVDVMLGDVHTIESGAKKLPVGGVSFFAGRDLPEHMTRGTAPTRFSVADTVRKMVFNSPQWVTAEPQVLQSGQRIPYLVVFSDPVRSYAQLLPGISEDPASAHHSDQAALASEGRLRSTYLGLGELLRNAESVRTLRVTSVKVERASHPDRG